MRDALNQGNRWVFPLAAIAFFCFAPTANAQPSSSSPTASITSVSLPYEDWHQSYARAVELARKTDRPIMIFFTRSDWCSESRQLTKKVFLTHPFARWSTDNVVKLEIDFPRAYQLPLAVRKQNEQLRHKYSIGVNSFPTILLINADGEVQGKIDCEPTSVYRWIDEAEMKLPLKRNVNDLEG